MSVIKDSVQKYYSEVLKSSSDLKTNACCASGEPPLWMKNLISNISDQVLDRFYGCGFPVSEAVEGCTVVDLGCGTGRDVYIYSQLVGESGRVIGIDMTEEQLAVAKGVELEQVEKFAYKKSNVSFIKSYIEDLHKLNLKNSVDLVVSNCVVNLSPDKKAVLNGVAEILKEGGEFYFSDVFCDRRLSDDLRQNEMLYGECLGGALYVNDFISLAKSCGFKDPRLVEESPIKLDDEVLELTGKAQFVSRTYRLFKLPELEDNCEDYGQSAEYLGTIPFMKHQFNLDGHHSFETGRPERVCGNTVDMLLKSRFKEHFKVYGSKNIHFGEFSCGDIVATEQCQPIEGSGSCC